MATPPPPPLHTPATPPPSRPPAGVSARSALDAHRDAHAAADAQARDALLRVALAHLVEQRDEDAAARGADRVADRDGAAVDVDLARVPAHLVVDGARLRREGFVDLEEVEVLRLPAGALQRLL